METKEKIVHIVVALIIKGRNIFITKRDVSTHFGGYWEFPGGKVESGETLIEALIRECQEELGTVIEVMERFQSFKYHYPDRHLEFHFYHCSLRNGEELKISDRARWIPLIHLNECQFPPANKEVIRKLKEM